MSPEATIESLQQELASTRAMVHTVMQSSADLGLVIDFLRTSFTHTNNQDLAQSLIEELEEQGLYGCIMLCTDTGNHLFTHTQQYAQRDCDFIEQHHKQGRIIEEGPMTLVNYQHASLLIGNMPDDDQRRGSYRDLLATLAEGLEAKALALQVESQAARDRQVKEEFFAIMSHELKTPLNSVIGFSELLSRRLIEKASEQEMKALTAIHENGQSLLGMIEDILELARFDSEEVVLHNHKIAIEPLMGELVEKMSNLAEERNNIIHLEVEPELRATTDQQKLNKILANLLSNAIKYTDGGDITLGAQLQQDGEHGHCLVLSIEDTGIGISPEHHETIFHQFSQVDTSVARRSNGIGIGLSFVQKLVDILGGRIELQSVPNQGSLFQIYLPQPNSTQASH